MKQHTLLALSLFFIPFSPLYGTELQMGGFIKANARYVEGNLKFQDSWTGGGSFADNTKRTQFSAQESRVNMTITSNEVQAFAEIDFVGSAQGNPIISNSYSPRLRHAFISYQGVTAGQTWSTLVNTSTFAETADLGGPLVGQAMIRQALVRYDTAHWQFALENPYTYGTQAPEQASAQTKFATELTSTEPLWIDTNHDYLPDMIVRYNQSGDWGNVSISGLLRYLDSADTAQWGGGTSIAAKIHSIGKDDLRIQLHYGHLGRYVGTDAARDITDGQLENSLSVMFAYRHFWTQHTRSSIFYGHTSTKVEQTDRSHFGVNLFTNLTQSLTLGAEIGRYQMQDNITYLVPTVSQPRATQGVANYAQVSLQFHF